MNDLRRVLHMEGDQNFLQGPKNEGAHCQMLFSLAYQIEIICLTTWQNVDLFCLL